jgi:uncharacterized membrane protein YgcG
MTPASTEKFDFTQTMKNKINTNTESTTGSPKKQPHRKNHQIEKEKQHLDSPQCLLVLFLVVWILFSVCSCFDCFLVFWSYILCAVELKNNRNYTG